MNVLFSFKQVQTFLTILVMMIFLIFGCFGRYFFLINKRFG